MVGQAGPSKTSGLPAITYKHNLRKAKDNNEISLIMEQLPESDSDNNCVSQR